MSERAPTVDVRYTCHECGLVDRLVDGVAERGGAEDVRGWVEYVRDQVGLDHATVSPKCRSTKCDLKLPVANESGVGVVGRKTRH